MVPASLDLSKNDCARPAKGIARFSRALEFDGEFYSVQLYRFSLSNKRAFEA